MRLQSGDEPFNDLGSNSLERYRLFRMDKGDGVLPERAGGLTGRQLGAQDASRPLTFLYDCSALLPVSPAWKAQFSTHSAHCGFPTAIQASYR